MKPQAIIWTEGKTDWQHLKRALQALRVNPQIVLRELMDDLGDDQLFKQCIAFAREPQECPNIFMFDRDKSDVVGKVTDSKGGHKDWGNNIFSFALPIPLHRKDQACISIEMYYTDSEIQTQDASGRRLFLSNEFNSQSGRHHKQSELSVANPSRLSSPKIIDSAVYDLHSCNVALSKADFAKNVLEGTGPFGTFNFEAFRNIASIIENIIQRAYPKVDLIFGDMDAFCRSFTGLDKPQYFLAAAGTAIRICKLVAMIFIASTIRYYEQRILNEASTDRKKIRPIRALLADDFGLPSLATLHKLAKQCYYLIDEHASSSMHTLRSLMVSNPILGNIGNLLDDLETLFPPSRRQHHVRIVDKAQLRKPIMDYIIPEFAKYEHHLSTLQRQESLCALVEQKDADTWTQALTRFHEILSSLGSIPFRDRTIKRVRNDSDEFEVILTTYHLGTKFTTEIMQPYAELKVDRLETYELLCDDGEPNSYLDIFPFLLIADDRLHYYSRTGAKGYEYLAPFTTRGHIELTRRKFNHAAIRTTTQGVFWTPTMPTFSSMGVKANLPGQERIIGRKQQITEILQNIIQVPNENGIIYGPGGVGKTALLLELARHLFEEGFYDQTCFKNIIWVSAKENYYNPILDVVEPGAPRIKSLDNVLTAILDFHEFEDPSGYDRESKKWLVLELFREEETLLILDNLESVVSAEQEEIIHFFGGDVKRELRDKPSNFKILITSRENIPSSFRQMMLKGLDQNESKELMDRIYQPYTHSKPQLPEEQRDAVYKATNGIPLIIKHCYGQLYEYNQPLDNVLRGLSLAGNKVIEFSFSEMIKFLQEDELQLRIILLLEIINRPIMPRHMADILLQPELEIGQRIARLVSYQCVEKSSAGTDDKYSITSEARSFTRRLVQQHAALSVDIKKLIANLTLEKRLDYSKDEYESVMQFQQYLIAGHYLPAEVFIKEKLRDHPDSLVLNLEYAKYLKNQKNKTLEAIERLESILARSGNDPQILRLLMVYYTALEDPNYIQADIYARELADIATGNLQTDFELARFYGSWSTSEKLKFELDPNREALRQQRYKELADKAIKILTKMTNRSSEREHLLAQAYYNRWDYGPALRHIDRAIEILPKDSHLGPPYHRLRAEIIEKEERYSNRRR